MKNGGFPASYVRLPEGIYFQWSSGQTISRLVVPARFLDGPTDSKRCEFSHSVSSLIPMENQQKLTSQGMFESMIFRTSRLVGDSYMLVPWRVPSGMSFLAVEYAVTSTIQQTRIYCSNIHIFYIYIEYIKYICYGVVIQWIGKVSSNGMYIGMQKPRRAQKNTYYKWWNHPSETHLFSAIYRGPMSLQL